ncbi:MAG: hypothetical protein H6822_10125 [Planctomycetaceae bacterium]|nr:hypothetical protein [Planctomycetales bacterium]MCB9922529.1 hypothetical protein [Planctomycetaceae bacterium]
MLYGLVILVVVGVAIVVTSIHRRAVARFNERFPPIGDDEFIRRCSPGTSRDIALRVRRIVSEQLGIEYERVYPEQRFIDDLSAD